MKVWFLKNFSSLPSVIKLIKDADLANEFVIAYSHTDPYKGEGIAADEFYVEPNKIGGDDYVEWVMQTAIDKKIDVIVPGIMKTLRFSQSDVIQKFAERKVRIMNVASYDDMELIEKKAEFYKAINLPMTPPAEYYVFKNVQQFDAGVDLLKGKHKQICVKPSVGVYASGFSLLEQNLNCAEILIKGLEYTVPLNDYRNGIASIGKVPKMMVMEFLPGDEYSADSVAVNGELITSVIRKKSIDDGTYQTVVEHPGILDSVRILAKQFSLNGVFNVQFRDRENGKPGILEINARMSGGVGMACLAGPVLPYIALKAFCTGSCDVPKIEYGTKIHMISVPEKL